MQNTSTTPCCTCCGERLFGTCEVTYVDEKPFCQDCSEYAEEAELREKRAEAVKSVLNVNG